MGQEIKEVIEAAKGLREATAACFRFIARRAPEEYGDEFDRELKAVGLSDGFGLMAQNAIAAAERFIAQHSPAEKLLYEAIRELAYVQEGHEACGSMLCATSKGAEIIERGKAVLGTSDLGPEELGGPMREWRTGE